MVCVYKMPWEDGLLKHVVKCSYHSLFSCKEWECPVITEPPYTHAQNSTCGVLHQGYPGLKDGNMLLLEIISGGNPGMEWKISWACCFLLWWQGTLNQILKLSLSFIFSNFPAHHYIPHIQLVSKAFCKPPPPFLSPHFPRPLEPLLWTLHYFSLGVYSLEPEWFVCFPGFS